MLAYMEQGGFSYGMQIYQPDGSLYEDWIVPYQGEDVSMRLDLLCAQVTDFYSVLLVTLNGYPVDCTVDGVDTKDGAIQLNNLDEQHNSLSVQLHIDSNLLLAGKNQLNFSVLHNFDSPSQEHMMFNGVALQCWLDNRTDVVGSLPPVDQSECVEMDELLEEDEASSVFVNFDPACETFFKGNPEKAQVEKQNPLRVNVTAVGKEKAYSLFIIQDGEVAAFPDGSKMKRFQLDEKHAYFTQLDLELEQDEGYFQLIMIPDYNEAVPDKTMIESYHIHYY